MQAGLEVQGLESCNVVDLLPVVRNAIETKFNGLNALLGSTQQGAHSTNVLLDSAVVSKCPYRNMLFIHVTT